MNTNKKHMLFALYTTLSLLPFSVDAGTNPIAWKLNQLFQNPVYVGRTYSVTYTLTNQLPIQLAKPLIISKNANPKNEFTYVDNCSGVRLASQASCTITVSLTARVSGTKQIQLTVGGYDNNQVNLPQISAQAIGSTPNGISATVSQSLPYQMLIGASANYSFTYTNNGSTTATDVIVAVTQSIGGTANITSNTCMNGVNPGTLAGGSSCTVTGSYTSNTTTPSTQSISGTLTFQGPPGSPVTVSTSTNVMSQGSSDYLVGSLVSPNYLPPVMLGSTAYPLQFLFTNVSSGQVDFSGAGVGSVTCIDSNSNNCNAAITGFTSNCNNYLPAPNPTAAACQLTATFNAPAASNPVTSYTITASVPYTTGTGSPATVSTSGTVVSSLPTTRTINLINQCSFPVWFSLNGSAVSGLSCDAQGNGCPSGTSCNTSTKLCYWNNAGPNSGSSYQLAANGGSNSVTIPAYNYGGVQWSGNISASTQCSGNSCVQASCSNQGGASSCAPGIGFSQPATQAEITMSVSAADSYDVEVINGFHIPISMAPFYYTGIAATADNYTCGIPGNYNATNGFGACNWGQNVSLPAPSNGTGHSSGYYWVTNGGTACSINSGSAQCPSGQVCGLYQNPSTSALSQVCGNFLGYWSADQVCSYSGLSSTVSTFFNCSLPLPTSSPSFPANATLYSLMACKVPTGDVNPLYNSCYLSYPGYTAEQIETCCGCVDWWNSSATSGQSIQANSATQSCGTQIDPTWTQYVQPMVQWMKAACPSAYVYPFDDKTSGFTCTNNLPNQQNSTDYTITFCQGNSGLPTGITEGRG